MSHYMNYVLVAGDKDNAKDKAQEMLSQYGLTPTVDEYMEIIDTLEPMLAERLGAESNDLIRSVREMASKLGRKETDDDPDNDQPVKYDWWDFGGRFNGTLAHAIRGPVIEEDVVPMTSLDLEKVPIPFAIITPDGRWHAKGEMWSGVRVFNVDNDWETKAKKILDEHADAVLVVVDCHI